MAAQTVSIGADGSNDASLSPARWGGAMGAWALASWAVALLGCGVLVVMPSLQIGYVTPDDEALVRRNTFIANPGVRSALMLFTYVERDLYQPLPLLTLMLERLVLNDPMTADGHQAAVLHHLMNGVYHGVAGVLLLLVLARLLGHVHLAGILAVFWTVHPMFFETTAVIANRIPIVAGLLLFAALLSYLRWLDRAVLAASASRVPTNASVPMVPSLPSVPATFWQWFAIAPGSGWLIGWTLLSQLCKTSPLLPIGLACCGFAVLQAARAARAAGSPHLPGGQDCRDEQRQLLDRQRLLVALWPLVWPTVIVGAFAVLAVWTSAQSKMLTLENQDPLFNVQLTIVALWHHLLAAAVPWWLSPVYFRPIAIDPLRTLLSAVALISVVGLLLWRLRREPLAWAGMGWWVLMLLPALPLLTTRNHLTADRYSYIALPGLLLAVGLLLRCRAQGPTKPEAPVRPLRDRFTALLAAGAVAVGGLAMNVAYQPTLASLPAMQSRIEAVYGPDHPQVLLTRAQVMYAMRGSDPDDPITAATLEILKPLQASLDRHAQYWLTLGRIYQDMGRHAESERAARRVQELVPGSPEPFELLGDLAMAAKDPKAAADAYAAALERHRNDPTIPLRLARAQLLMGQPQQALRQLLWVIETWPYYSPLPYAMLSRIAFDQGDLATAERWIRRAIAMHPRDAQYWVNLAAIQFRAGQTADAQRAMSTALELDPDIARRVQENALPTAP